MGKKYESLQLGGDGFEISVNMDTKEVSFIPNEEQDLETMEKYYRERIVSNIKEILATADHKKYLIDSGLS